MTLDISTYGDISTQKRDDDDLFIYSFCRPLLSLSFVVYRMQFLVHYIQQMLLVQIVHDVIDLYEIKNRTKTVQTHMDMDMDMNMNKNNH